jgi:peptide/nickel transport system permease protein
MIGGQAIPPITDADLALTLDPNAAPAGGESQGIGGLGILMLRVFVENKLALVGLGFVVFMILFSFLGPFFYHTNQTTLVLTNINQFLAAPSAQHLLGTDIQGYDQVGRLMYAGRATLEISLGAAAAATIFGVIYGAISGFLGGWVDAILMRVVDCLLSIPSLFLLIVLAAIEQRITLVLLIFIVAVIAWLVPARLIRGETLTLRTREYVQAVKGMGGSRRRIVMRHIVPNAVGTIVVNATFQVADAMLLVAALGYLGFGLTPPQTTWGNMLSDGVTYLSASPPKWWVFYPAGVAIIVTVLGFNFMGDALRDSFETRLQKR